MRFHFINVGYGEAILIEKNDFTILVDGGTNRPEEYAVPGCVRACDYIEKSGVGKIDLMIITHLHDDHVSGLVDVIENFEVKRVWVNLKPAVDLTPIINKLLPLAAKDNSGMLFINALKSFAKILKECDNKGITTEQICKENGRIQLEEDISIDILSPALSVRNKMSDLFYELSEEKDITKAERLFYELDSLENTSSMAIRIKSGEMSALLTSDQTEGWEEAYREYDKSLESQILKVPHHGQVDGMPQAMLDLSNPCHIVICTSADKRYNSAHPSIIERARKYLWHNHKNNNVYVTAINGTVILPPL